MEPTCSLIELSDYVVLPTCLKALLFKWIIIKKPTGQLGHGSQLCEKSWKFKNPHPGIEKFVTESVRKSPSQSIKLYKRPSALMIDSGPYCLVNPNLPALSLSFHGQWADYIAVQLLWEGYRQKIENGW